MPVVEHLKLQQLSVSQFHDTAAQFGIAAQCTAQSVTFWPTTLHWLPQGALCGKSVCGKVLHFDGGSGGTGGAPDDGTSSDMSTGASPGGALQIATSTPNPEGRCKCRAALSRIQVFQPLESSACRFCRHSSAGDTSVESAELETGMNPAGSPSVSSDPVEGIPVRLEIHQWTSISRAVNIHTTWPQARLRRRQFVPRVTRFAQQTAPIRMGPAFSLRGK